MNLIISFNYLIKSCYGRQSISNFKLPHVFIQDVELEIGYIYF